MNKWIRLGAMAIAFAATIIFKLVPGADGAFEWGSLIATFALAAWNAWKNNDFTFAAEVGTEIMHAIKDGEITADEALKILDTED